MDHYPFRKFISSIADLEEIIKRVRDYKGQLEFNVGNEVTELYRGQGRDCWKLIPKIARDFTDPEKIKEIEKAIINDFCDELNKESLYKHVQEGFFRGKFHSDWLLIQQAQHYELPTRFMDWAGRWEAALCFAVADERDDKYDGQFWIYLVKEENWISDNGVSQYLSQDPFEYDRTIFLNSASLGSCDSLIKIAQHRKSKQMGRFCVQPYSTVAIPLEEQKQHQPNLHKVIIPAGFKKIIRDELAEIGVTKETLYVSAYLNNKELEQHNKTVSIIDCIVEKLMKKYLL